MVTNLVKGNVMHQKYDKMYFNSDVWRCNVSPTGIHYWEVNASGSTQTCNHCGTIVVLPVKNTSFDRMRENRKNRIK